MIPKFLPSLFFLFFVQLASAQQLYTFTCWIPLDTLSLPKIARWNNIQQDTQLILKNNLPLLGSLPKYLIEKAEKGNIQFYDLTSNKPIKKEEVVPFLEEYCCANKSTSLKSLNYQPYSKIISVSYKLVFTDQTLRFIPVRIYLYEYLPQTEQGWIERTYIEIESSSLKEEIIKRLELTSGKSNWQLWIE